MSQQGGLPTPSFPFSSPVAWTNPSPRLRQAMLQLAGVTRLLQPRRLLPVIGSHLPNPKTVLADEAFPRASPRPSASLFND